MRLADINWFHYAAPQRFHPLAGRLVPWFMAAAVLLTLAGLYVGFFVAPTDATQGEVYRVIFIHVPAAWMSMVVYLAMAFWAAVGLIFNARLASMLALALAPTGALMTFVALWTGALWGKPTWGTWWVWDARLTSELILLFLYIGYMSLHAAIEDPRRADRAAAVLAIVGAVVEHAAPGRLGQPDERAEHGRHDARGHAADGAGRLGLLHRGGADARARADGRARTPRGLGAGGAGRMNWGSAAEFFAMGGHGLYVWGSFGVTALAIAGELIALARRKRAAERKDSLE